MRSINIPLLGLLLQGIPEQIAVVTLACVIAGIPLDVKKIIAIGIILAGCAYVVRLFPVPFGVHSILLTIILFIALIWLSKGNLSLSIITCLLSYLALAVFEFVCLSLLMPIFEITPEVLSTDLVMRIIVTEPQVLLLFILSFTLNKFFLKKVNKDINNEVYNEFFSKMSKNLTNVITKELGVDEEKKEIITYGFETLILLVIGWFLLIIFGYALNALVPIVITAVFGGILRELSGGAHFNSPLKCLAFGTLIYCSLGVLAKKLVDYNLTDKYVLIICLLASSLPVAFLAPVDSPAKPIYSQSFKTKLKILSVIFVIISLLIITLTNNTLLNISVVLGISYQSITLLPVLNKKGRWV